MNSDYVQANRTYLDLEKEAMAKKIAEDNAVEKNELFDKYLQELFILEKLSNIAVNIGSTNRTREVEQFAFDRAYEIMLELKGGS
jgi:hypothetical protein